MTHTYTLHIHFRLLAKSSIRLTLELIKNSNKKSIDYISHIINLMYDKEYLIGNKEIKIIYNKKEQKIVVCSNEKTNNIYYISFKIDNIFLVKLLEYRELEKKFQYSNDLINFDVITSDEL